MDLHDEDIGEDKIIGSALLDLGDLPIGQKIAKTFILTSAKWKVTEHQQVRLNFFVI